MSRSEHSREEAILGDLKATFEEAILEGTVKPRRIRVLVEPSKILEVAKYLKEHIGFDYINGVTGIDYPKEEVIEVVYHISSMMREELKSVLISLATKLPRSEPTMPSLINIWRGVEFHERETFEMLGVKFEGHPDLRPLLLPEDWEEAPPLRKDFRPPGKKRIS